MTMKKYLFATLIAVLVGFGIGFFRSANRSRVLFSEIQEALAINEQLETKIQELEADMEGWNRLIVPLAFSYSEANALVEHHQDLILEIRKAENFNPEQAALEYEEWAKNTIAAREQDLGVTFEEVEALRSELETLQRSNSSGWSQWIPPWLRRLWE